MKNLRFLKHSFGQRVSYDGVLTRLGELSEENSDALAKMVIHDDATYNLLVGAGGRFSVPAAANSFNITGPALWLHKVSTTDVVQLVHTNTATYSYASVFGTAWVAPIGNPRIDLVQGRWTKVPTRQITVDIIDPSTGIISQASSNTDYEVRLEVKGNKGATGAVPSCPILSVGTAAKATGTVVLTPTVDLSMNSRLCMSVNGGTYLSVSCAGGIPSVTTIAQIVTAITTAFPAVTAGNDGAGHLSITTIATGLATSIEFVPCASNDAIDLILGLSKHFNYYYLYEGTADWFKIGEFYTPIGTVSLKDFAGGVIWRDVDQRATWEKDNGNVETVYSLYQMQKAITDLGYDAVVTHQSGGSIPQMSFEYWFGTAAQFAAGTASSAGWNIDGVGGNVHVPGNFRMLLLENTDPTSTGTASTAERYLGGHYSYQLQGGVAFDTDSRNILIRGVDDTKVGIRWLADIGYLFRSTVEAFSVTTVTGSNTVTIVGVHDIRTRVGVGDYVMLNSQDDEGTGSFIYQVDRITSATQMYVDRNVGTGASTTWYRPPQHIVFEGLTLLPGTFTGGFAVFEFDHAADVRFNCPIIGGGRSVGTYLLMYCAQYQNRDLYFREILSMLRGHIESLHHAKVDRVHGFDTPSPMAGAVKTCDYCVFGMVDNIVGYAASAVFDTCDHTTIQKIGGVEGIAMHLCSYCDVGKIFKVTTSGNGAAMLSCTYCSVQEITGCSAVNGGALSRSSNCKVGLISVCSASTAGGALHDSDHCEVGAIVGCTATTQGGGISNCDALHVGLISGCSSATGGGAYASSSLDIEEIIGCTTTGHGGGMRGCSGRIGSIINCSSSAGSGGGVQTMLGSIDYISGCTAFFDGGGVDGAIFTVFGNIRACTAVNGGGAKNLGDCTVHRIEACTASNQGGGVHTASRCHFGEISFCVAVTGASKAGAAYGVNQSTFNGAKGNQSAAPPGAPAAKQSAIDNTDHCTFYGNYVYNYDTTPSYQSVTATVSVFFCAHNQTNDYSITTADVINGIGGSTTI